MPTYLTPGVYVEEVPSAVRPIAGVGTSTAGFVGFVADDGRATVVEITDRAPWQALMEPVYAKYAADPAMAAVVRRIRETR